MDEHRPPLSNPKPFASDNRFASAGQPAPKQDRTEEKNQGMARDVASHATNAAGEVIEHAKNAAEEVIDHAKGAAADTVASMAEDVARQAPDIARRARDQAATVADDLYRSGSEYLTHGVSTYPLTSVIMAAVVGYGLGYLFSRR